MTTLNMYETNLEDFTQQLIANNIEAERIVVKYYTGIDIRNIKPFTCILWVDGTNLKLAKIDHNDVKTEMTIDTDQTANDANFSLSYDSTQALVCHSDSSGSRQSCISLTTMTVLQTESNATITDSNVASVIHTGIDQQYYVVTALKMYRYNATTQEVMYLTFATNYFIAAYVVEDIIYTLEGGQFRSYTDTGSSFTNLDAVSIIVASDIAVQGLNVYILVSSDSSIRKTALDFTSEVVIDLTLDSITNPSTIYTENLTSKIFFSGLQGGKKRKFELLANDTVVEVSEYGSYGKEDSCGAQLQIMNN